MKYEKRKGLMKFLIVKFEKEPQNYSIIFNVNEIKEISFYEKLNLFEITYYNFNSNRTINYNGYFHGETHFERDFFYFLNDPTCSCKMITVYENPDFNN